MGLSLIAITLSWHLLGLIAEVALGLGMVIFVHELGHFAVAKWCGVKCEKFYLGFDIYGLKLLKFQWGETEYGIGILPLGGYVKMLGQDDNPARAAEERERSRLQTASVESSESSSEALDPRSYMAKSVPQRMAIISAGVVMNVIFAFVLAVVAYGLGVRDIACGVSATVPGEPAWRADLQPGDMFIAIDDSGDRPLRWNDLMSAVALGNIEQGIDFEVVRPGVEKPFIVHVKPEGNKNRLRPTIGVIPPRTNTLSSDDAVIASTPAAAVGEFLPGDRIVAMNGAPVDSYADFESELQKLIDQPIRFAVERKEKQSKSPETVEITVPARPVRTLGLVMKMGKITAVQDDSPAAAAGLKADDFIVSIDGQPPGDPLRLPEELRRRAGQTITLSIRRTVASGEDEKLEKQITLREPKWPEEAELPGTPVSVPALGITYQVLNIVHEAEKDSPAADATLAGEGEKAQAAHFSSGDEIVQAEFLLSKQKREKPEHVAEAFPSKPDPIAFGDEKPNWPYFMRLVQWAPPGTKIRLTLKDGRTTVIEPVDADGWYYFDRGLIPAMELTTTKAQSLAEAMSLAARETEDVVVQVYSFIRKMGSQVSPLSLGGPVTIAEAAGSAASEGVSKLLIFLTMLSANLAVLNFLPIPLLDGGHMVFLALEGLMGRPVNERVVVAFHYLGFVFIISLMIFVLGLDFGVIPRHH